MASSMDEAGAAMDGDQLSVAVRYETGAGASSSPLYCGSYIVRCSDPMFAHDRWNSRHDIFPLVIAVPSSTIAPPANIIGVTFSPRKEAPQIIPKRGIKKVTDAAYAAPTFSTRRKNSTYAKPVQTTPSAATYPHVDTEIECVGHSHSASGASTSEAKNWLPKATTNGCTPAR